MDAVVLSCPMIQVLELIGHNEAGLPTPFIRAKELSAIAQCLQLKRLTLSDFNIDSGQFFDLVCFKPFIVQFCSNYFSC